MEVKDYSQFGEQAAILSALTDTVTENLPQWARIGPDVPRFLDIGAWHPTQFSNTRALYELGWGGVMIEPSPGPMMNLLDAYGNDDRVTLVQAAVGLNPGMVTLHVTDDAVTTGSEAEYERWKDTAKFRGVLSVPVLTLAEIANRYGGFDFWSIDAEGISADLFREAMQRGYFPKCMAIEHDSRTTELLELATGKGYKCLLCNSTNVVVSR